MKGLVLILLDDMPILVGTKLIVFALGLLGLQVRIILGHASSVRLEPIRLDQVGCSCG
jgi:hypothetical protein